MDGRKRQWMAMDPGYYSNPLTVKLFARFGSAGVIVFDAFLRASKYSFVEGQVSYANPDQLLNMLGLPPSFELVDNTGEKWDLDDLWRVLGDHHMTARRRQDDRTTIVARRWDDWQKRRSPTKSADTKTRLTETLTKTKTSLSVSQRVNAALSELAERDSRTIGKQGNPRAVLVTCRRTRVCDSKDDLTHLAKQHLDWSSEALANAVDLRDEQTKVELPDCEPCGNTRWSDPDDGPLIRCEACWPLIMAGRKAS